MLPEIVFNEDVLSYLKRSLCNDEACRRFDELECVDRFHGLISRLSIPPCYTTLRINSRQLSATQSDILYELSLVLSKQYNIKGWVCPEMFLHPAMPDCVVIRNEGPLCPSSVVKEVMVDLSCGMAVLRGADIFVQGILAATSGVLAGDKVSVYIDVEHRCTKGLTKIFTRGRKVYIGNGVAKYGRDEVFGSSQKLSGVGVSMTEPLYVAPALSDVAPDRVFAQNIPSIACVHVLSPLPGETILDMCAAPGGKTTHITTLMNNEGRVVALDKSKNKIKTILQNVKRWGLNNVEVYWFDSTKVVDDTADMSGGPPYPRGQFDRVLVDAPCSGLGQRPSLCCLSSLAEVTSYPALQKKIFTQAEAMLKPGGTLVYSTCTITLEENESIVAWALKTFPQLRLAEQTPSLAGPGWPGSGLKSDEEKLVQRFSPSPPYDCSSCHHCCNEDVNSFCGKNCSREAAVRSLCVTNCSSKAAVNSCDHKICSSETVNSCDHMICSSEAAVNSCDLKICSSEAAVNRCDKTGYSSEAKSDSNEHSSTAANNCHHSNEAKLGYPSSCKTGAVLNSEYCNCINSSQCQSTVNHFSSDVKCSERNPYDRDTIGFFIAKFIKAVS